MGETSKIRSKIEKYLGGRPIDIGCGDDKVCPDAIGIDGRDLPGVDFVTNGLCGLPEKLPEMVEEASSVFSSHVLEHLPNAFKAILEWSYFIKRGGYLILQLPDGRYYNNYENREHFQDTTHPQFVFWFRRTFCGEALNYKGEQYAPPIFEMVEDGLDIGEDRYSFYLVAKKI